MIFAKLKCFFKKGFSVENCLLHVFEKWRDSIDQGEAFGVLLTGLFKAFYCLPHERMIARLRAYGLDMMSIRLVYYYLSIG